MLIIHNTTETVVFSTINVKYSTKNEFLVVLSEIILY